MDADFSHHPRYVPAVVALAEQYHVGIGFSLRAGRRCKPGLGACAGASESGRESLPRTVLGLKSAHCTRVFAATA